MDVSCPSSSARAGCHRAPRPSRFRTLWAVLLALLVLAGAAEAEAERKKERGEQLPEGRVEVKVAPPEGMVMIFALSGQGEEIVNVEYDARFSRIKKPCPQAAQAERTDGANEGEPAKPKLCSRSVLRRIGFPPKVRAADGSACDELELVAVRMNRRPIAETVPSHGVRPKRDLRWYVAGRWLEDGGTVTAIYDCPGAGPAAPDPEIEAPAAPADSAS